MITLEGFIKTVIFMSPGAGVVSLGRGHISHKVKMHYFFKNLLLYSHAYIRQNKYIVMMTKEVSTENVKFHNPRGRHSCARVLYLIKNLPLYSEA